jgi:hypothetical protein
VFSRKKENIPATNDKALDLTFDKMRDKYFNLQRKGSVEHSVL